MNSIATTFASFRQQTADDVSAAILTLAAVIRGEQADDKPLTVKAAAERLGVSSDTIYGMVESGELPCQRIGKGRGTIRISPAALDKVGKPRILKLREL
jgi:excisionase family DNA binding protein